MPTRDIGKSKAMNKTEKNHLSKSPRFLSIFWMLFGLSNSLRPFNGDGGHTICSEMAVMARISGQNFHFLKNGLWSCNPPQTSTETTVKYRCSAQVKRCPFFSETINYIGYLKRPERLKIAETTTKRGRKLQGYTLQTEVPSFLSHCNVFR